MAPPSFSLFAGKIGKRASRGANAVYLFLGGSPALGRIGHDKWPRRYSARLGGSAMMPLLSMTLFEAGAINGPTAERQIDRLSSSPANCEH